MRGLRFESRPRDKIENWREKIRDGGKKLKIDGEMKIGKFEFCEKKI